MPRTPIDIPASAAGLIIAAAGLLLTPAPALSQMVSRPIELPRGSEAPTALVYFHTAGHSDARGQGIAVVDEKNQPAPFRLLAHDPAGQTVIAVPAAGKLTLQYDRAPLKHARRDDELPVGLILRTWQLRGRPAVADANRSIDALRPYHVAPVPAITLAYNPFGQSTHFYAEFEGLLKPPGDLKIFATNDDGAVVDVDGQTVISQPTASVIRDAKQIAGRATNVSFKAAPRRVRFRWTQTGGEAMALLGYMAGERAVPIPEKFYVPAAVAKLGPATMAGGGVPIGFDAQLLDQVNYEDQTYHRYRFAAIAPAPKGVEHRWTFSDGSTATGQTVEHVFVGGDRTARLELVTGGAATPAGVAARLATNELPGYVPVTDNPDLVVAYAKAINASDMSGASPGVLEAWYTLVWQLERYDLVRPTLEAYLARGGVSQAGEMMRYTLATAIAAEDPARAAQIFGELARGASDPWLAARAGAEQIDILLYDLKQPQLAEGFARSYAGGKSDQGRALLIARQGDVQRLAGQHEQASKSYQQAQRVALRNADARRMSILERAHRENVLSLLDQRRYPAVREALLAWEAEFPASKLGGDLGVLTARYFQEIGQHARAARDLKMIVDGHPLHPARPELLYRLALSLYKLDRKAEAEPYVKELVSVFPNSPFTAQMKAQAK